jgi:hypothetical protein
MDAAEQWEPDEARASRPVLRARGGEIPPRDSPCATNALTQGGAVLCKRWREVLRSRPSGAGSKPPQAATVKSRGGERCGKGGT